MHLAHSLALRALQGCTTCCSDARCQGTPPAAMCLCCFCFRLLAMVLGAATTSTCSILTGSLRSSTQLMSTHSWHQGARWWLIQVGTRVEGLKGRALRERLLCCLFMISPVTGWPVSYNPRLQKACS